MRPAFRASFHAHQRVIAREASPTAAHPAGFLCRGASRHDYAPCAPARPRAARGLRARSPRPAPARFFAQAPGCRATARRRCARPPSARRCWPDSSGCPRGGHRKKPVGGLVVAHGGARQHRDRFGADHRGDRLLRGGRCAPPRRWFGGRIWRRLRLLPPKEPGCDEQRTPSHPHRHRAAPAGLWL